MALTAYAAKHSECAAGGAEAWLLGEGQDRLGAAYALDWPASGTIVLAAFLLFGGTLLIRRRG